MDNNNQVMNRLILSPRERLLVPLPTMTDPARGDCLVVICKSTSAEPAGRVTVGLHTEPGDSAAALARREVEIHRIGVILLPVTGGDQASRYMRVVADSQVELTGYLINADTTVSVDIPLSLLGPECAGELASVNDVLSRIVDYRINEMSLAENTAQAVKKKKVYICGFNKKNKGTTCTVVNVIICGKKKDKKILEDVEEIEINLRGEEQGLVAGDLTALDLEPYMGLILDGGRLQTDGSDSRVDEFNTLGLVLRSLEGAEGVRPTARQ